MRHSAAEVVEAGAAERPRRLGDRVHVAHPNVGAQKGVELGRLYLRRRHIFLGELRDRLDELDRSRPHATYCASGFRASMAASILAANGFEDVRNVPGSWKAWKSAGYEVENTR